MSFANISSFDHRPRNRPGCRFPCEGVDHGLGNVPPGEQVERRLARRRIRAREQSERVAERAERVKCKGTVHARTSSCFRDSCDAAPRWRTREHAEQDEDGRDRVERRIEAFLDPPEDLERQRLRAGAGSEVCDDQLVEGKRECHQRTRDDGRHEIRDEYFSKMPPTAWLRDPWQLLRGRDRALPVAPAPPPVRTGNRR